MYWNGGGWIWMVLMMILFWGGLIVLAMVLLRGVGTGGRGGQATGPPPPAPLSGPDATEILRARFARGEITEDEYRKSLAILDETKR